MNFKGAIPLLRSTGHHHNGPVAHKLLGHPEMTLVLLTNAVQSHN